MILLLACASREPARPPNVLLVTMDTVRADHVGTFGGKPGTTPNVDALAAQGAAFTAAESPANESAFAHAGLFTGRYATEVLAVDYTRFLVPLEAEILPEILHIYGYHTAAFVGGGHVGAAFGFDQGWDTFEEQPGFGSFAGTVPGALSWIASAPEPWFLWVHGYDAHIPYATPGPWAPSTAAPGDAALWARNAVEAERIVAGRYDPTTPVPWLRHVSGQAMAGLGALGGGRRVTAAERSWLQGRYDAAISFADAQVGRILHAVSGRSDVLVVVVGDHGEDVLDHGFVNHRHDVFESCIHVPLVVAGAGFPAVRIDEPVSTRAVFSTVLAAANIPRPAGVDAQPLQRVASGRASVPYVFSEGVAGELAVRDAHWKLIVRGLDLTSPTLTTQLLTAPVSLFDLAADPQEQTDRVADAPTEVGRLREALVDWRARVQIAPAAREPPQPPWARDEMRQHGYW